jgi:hypothetical protein
VEYGLKSDTPTVWRELQIKNLQIDQPKRSVVAYITTDRVDEEGEVVVPEGIDFSRFKSLPRRNSQSGQKATTDDGNRMKCLPCLLLIRRL